MLVMNVVAEILKKEGVSTLFCFPTTPIIEAAAAVGIKPVICRQERVGVHMADGFSRVSNGRPPGVFAMQYGPGAENAFAGVVEERAASSGPSVGSRVVGLLPSGAWAERVRAPSHAVAPLPEAVNDAQAATCRWPV